jgi:hypothetical protein
MTLPATCHRLRASARTTRNNRRYDLKLRRRLRPLFHDLAIVTNNLLPGDLEPEIEHFALAFRSEFRRHPRADLELFGCRRRVGQIKRRRAALGGRSGRRPGRLVQRARNLPPQTGITA